MVNEQMVNSMTGYGKAEYIFSDHKTIVEIRSVNSKQLDLTLKMASIFRDKELDIRSILTAPLERGKVDVAIYTQPLDNNSADNFTPVNWQAVNYYADEYRLRYGSVPPEVMASIMRYPDVLKPNNQELTLSDDEWALLQAAIKQALQQLQAFRLQEGQALQRMFTDKLDGIADLLLQVEPYEQGRVQNIKQHLLANLQQLAETTKQQIDQNRLEAELIYYLEKLDITEEKVRLTNHIKYFRETMDSTHYTLHITHPNGVGKKLGFIAQEMGREINTLGSKSNQSEMQILVVKMKDLLEQIKEQILNVL